MSFTLRWSAKPWEEAPFMCRLFGHIWKDGWWGDLPYLSLGTSAWDGIDELHIDLKCSCDRCGGHHSVGRIHASTVVKKLHFDQDRGLFLRRFKVFRKAE